MKPHSIPTSLRTSASALAALIVLTGSAAAGTPLEVDEAAELVKSSGVKGGMVVHVGCGGGNATAALRVSESFVVQGLEADDKRVATARELVCQSGCYGPVSVAKWNQTAGAIGDLRRTGFGI